MNGLVAALVMAAMAAITLVAVGVALRLHFQGQRALAECAMLLDYALDMDDRCAALQAMVTDPLNERLTGALHESERELAECRHERRALALKLAASLSKTRTVPIRRVDATKPGE